MGIFMNRVIWVQRLHAAYIRPAWKFHMNLSLSLIEDIYNYIPRLKNRLNQF
jgi:hypothetical protein